MVKKKVTLTREKAKGLNLGSRSLEDQPRHIQSCETRYQGRVKKEQPNVMEQTTPYLFKVNVDAIVFKEKRATRIQVAIKGLGGQVIVRKSIKMASIADS